MSVRQVGRTPNPYNGTTPTPFGAGTTPASAYGGPPAGNMYGMTPRTPHGYQTPSHRPSNPMPPPAVPPGMNPARAAAMLQQNSNSSGWGQNSGWP
jgi:transcription elongation factor SPT6